MCGNFLAFLLLKMAYEIHIDGFIGDAGFFGGDSFTLKNLNDQLAEMPTDTTEINVLINSGGGYVTEGFAIYDRLASLNQTVNTTVLGLCGSIATVIAQAGKKGLRSGYENSDYFIHNPHYTPQSPDPLEAADLQAIADDLLVNQNKIANFYAKVSGKDATFFLEKMKEAKSLSMTDAKEFGLIDNIISTHIQAATIYKFAAHISKQQTAMNKIETFLTEKFAAFKNEITAIVKPTVKNEAATTDDGTIVYFDGGLEVGTQVFSDEAMTALQPDGDIMVGGNTYTILNGAVSAVVEKQVENKKTDLELANETIATLKAELETVKGGVTASVETAVEAAKNELKVEFENKFTAFKGTFFTGDKLKNDIVQMIKDDNTPAPQESMMERVVALRKSKQPK